MRQILFLFLLIPNLLLSQESTIIVKDASTSDPISQVQIETNNGDIFFTDEDGKTSISGNISEVTISKEGYVTINQFLVDKINIIELETEIFSSDVESGIISLTDFDLSDDSNTSDFASGLLSSYNDVFQSIAAYQFGPARFRQRGYDSRNNKILMNGVEVNKIYDGRPQWSNWGGLNDVLRNREYSVGLEKSRSAFGGINGSTNFILRTSLYQKGLRVSYSSTNTSYTNRVLATYSTDYKNWDFTFSVSRRWAEEGHFQGTFYDANSLFIGIENKINDNFIESVDEYYSIKKDSFPIIINLINKYNRISETGQKLIKDWKKNAQNFRKLSDSSIYSYSRDIKFFLSFIENYKNSKISIIILETLARESLA